ncbi:MAG TPA: urease accessory protein UreD [Polyangiaceae bacterium]
MNAAPTMPGSAAAAPGGWKARLELDFRQIAGRTRLVHRRHVGPLHVQRPFHPEPSPGGAAHVYLLHPPGGLVGGDSLSIRARALEGAEVLLTTPAATKFYRSAGDLAAQRVALEVGEDAAVEWLPQETIVFGGARGQTQLRVDVARGGKFLGWELCCLGRPASGDSFDSGSYGQRLEIHANGRPVCVERAHFSSRSPVTTERFGLAGCPVFGTLIALTDREDLAAAVRAVLPPPRSGSLFGVTVRRGALVCRYLGDSVARAREGFIRVWTVLRVALLGRPVVLPRIWAT